jgi:type IV pilus assembly protein PilV
MLSRGFTLIEVLVTLVILLFGLLGIAGLMAKGQKASFEAYQRQQALSLANDMVERVLANRTQADVYTAGAPVNTPVGIGGDSYSDLLEGSTTNCALSNCSPQNLADYDLAMWEGLLQGYGERASSDDSLVGGIIDARGCVEEIADTAAACPAAPAPPNTFFTRTLRISVAWQGQEDTAAPEDSACGQDEYGPDTRRRLVVLDTMVQNQCP